MDWTPIFQGLASAMGLVITGLAGIYVPRAIAAYERAANVKLTDQQKAAVYAAVETDANLLKAQVLNGLVPLEHATSPKSPAVQAAAVSAMNRVSGSAQAQGTTSVDMQQMIAGKVADKFDHVPTIQLKMPTDAATTQIPSALGAGHGSASSSVGFGSGGGSLGSGVVRTPTFITGDGTSAQSSVAPLTTNSGEKT